MARMLTQGTTGSDVRNLQRLLNFHFRGSDVARLDPDGIFGSRTRAAVIRLQHAAGIREDGIVGPITNMALFPLANGMAAATAVDSNARRAAASDLSRLRSSAMSQSSTCALCMSRLPAFGAPRSVGADPTPDPKPPIIVFQNLTVQGGNQWAWRAYAPSPFVIGVGGTVVLRWSEVGLSGAKLSPSGQFAVNGLNSPNGQWTGQGGVQFSPVIPSADKYTKLFGGQLDLGMPSVSLFVQKNENNRQFQGGVGLGLQPSWGLVRGTGDDPVLSLFLNASVVAAWNLGDGQGQPVSPQIMGGLSLDLWQLTHQKK